MHADISDALKKVLFIATSGKTRVPFTTFKQIYSIQKASKCVYINIPSMR